MTQALGHDRDVDTGCEHQRSGTVAQVVQAHAAKAGLGGELDEALGYVVGRQRRAVLAGEHQVVVPVCRAPCGALFVLAQTVLEKGARRAGCKVDDAVFARGGLRLAECDPGMFVPAHPARLTGGDLDDLLADHEDAAVEVDVTPAQTEGFPAAKAGSGHDLEQHTEAVTGGVVKERAELDGLPRSHLRPRCCW